MIKKRLFLMLPLMMILVFLLVQSFNRGISSVFYINFIYFVSPPILNQNLVNAESLLKGGNDFSADNPIYYQFNGITKVLQSGMQLIDADKSSLLKDASDDYRQSILLQPDNPFSWLNLAKSDYYQGREHYPEYLEKALRYGHSEQSVLLVYIDFALFRWNDLGEQRQEELVELVKNTILAKDFSLNNSGKQLNKLLVKYQLKSELCEQVISSKKIQDFCNIKYK